MTSPRGGRDTPSTPSRSRALASGSPYKVPRSVSFAEGLPHTASGKILKRELREPYWRGRRTRVG